MLSGSLDVFNLADVLRLICDAGATGRIRVRRDGRAGLLTVAGGRVTGATLDDGQASDEDGSIDAALEILSGKGGEFDLASGSARGPLDLDIDGLLERVSERQAEWNEVTQALGSLDTSLRLSPDPGSERVTMTASEWRVVSLVDGRRSARGIAEELGGSSFRTYKALAELMRGGLIGPEGTEVTVVKRTRKQAVEETPEDASDLDPAALLRELGGGPASAQPHRRIRILTREEQRMRLRK